VRADCQVYREQEKFNFLGGPPPRINCQGKLGHDQKFQSVKKISEPSSIYIFLRASNPQRNVTTTKEMLEKV
jgi:hypothetical protein